MTHVFVAPHPDDVALSCGGLIASLRELGQNVTILTVFSGNGAGDGLTPYQREALGFGSKTMWPSTEAFNRERILPRRPARRPPGWPHEERLEATQADADAVGQAVLAALVVVSARQHPQRIAGRAAGHRRPLDAGRGPDRRDRRRRRGRRPHGRAAASRTSASPTSPRRRSSSSTCPTPSSAATRATSSCSARRAPTTRAPFDLLRQEIDRLEPQQIYLPLGRRWPRRPPARAARSASSC